ncbi:MAG: hypothetical protein IKO63_03525, partial [Paludibacteraceae bacterium]|nr:hypothetical protein [Paludibacteraceae bacterium]
MLAVVPADEAFGYRPWQSAFVRRKTAGYQFLLFGQLLLAVNLFGYGALNLFVQFVNLFLLLALFGYQRLLFGFQVLEHCFLLLFVGSQLV